MVICLCKGVSDRKIRELIANGASTLREIVQSCKAGSDCGSCVCQVRELLSEACKGGEAETENAPPLERAANE